jgi:hypothetical protein
MNDVENPRAGHGAVVLDIGGDIGALVLTMPAELVGAEIEICPAGHFNDVPDEGRDWWQGEWRAHHGHAHGAPGPAWPHVAVVARRSPAGVRYAAVFPALREGTYEVWLRPHRTTAMVVTVPGGAVTTATWL